ncbi:MAG: hypothetical protein JWQ38_93 [Flavipsychrobacter sp.]|nr:hypothetical protein [Flavipsychrobacter sp.]
MKQLVLFLFTLLIATKASCQVEFIKHAEQNGQSLYGIAHVTDAQGNTYLLGTEGEFQKDNDGITCRTGGSTYTLYKINGAGNIVWQSTIAGNAGYMHDMFVTDSSIFIPYTISGFRAGRSKTSGVIIEMPAEVPYGVFINKKDGKVFQKTTLSFYCKLNDNGMPYYIDTPDVVFFTAVQHNDKTVSCVSIIERKCEKTSNNYYIPGAHNIIESTELDEKLGFVKKSTGADVSDLFLYNDFVYDAIDDRYILADSTGLRIYNRNWQLERRISLPGIDTICSPSYKIAFNEQYYVVNYGSDAAWENHTHYTAVITKIGRVVSANISPRYEVLGISKDNRIYAVLPGRKYGSDDSTVHPVRIVMMNIKQRSQKYMDITEPYVHISALSFTSSNDVVLSGTSMTTISHQLPKTPNGIYYYKERVTK